MSAASRVDASSRQFLTVTTHVATSPTGTSSGQENDDCAADTVSKSVRDTVGSAVGAIVGEEVGDDEGNLMAFSKKTGKRVWTSESKQPAGHSGGLSLMTVDGIPCVAVMTIRNLLVARLDPGHEGQTLATYPWITDFGNNIATPVIDGQSVVITSAYNKSSVVRLEVSRKGIRQVWTAPYLSLIHI
mgnify:CR=1 FL=1